MMMSVYVGLIINGFVSFSYFIGFVVNHSLMYCIFFFSSTLSHLCVLIVLVNRDVWDVCVCGCEEIEGTSPIFLCVYIASIIMRLMCVKSYGVVLGVLHRQPLRVVILIVYIQQHQKLQKQQQIYMVHIHCYIETHSGYSKNFAFPSIVLYRRIGVCGFEYISNYYVIYAHTRTMHI